MIEGEPSKTALHVAAARAAHLRLDPAPHILEDHCAEPLLGDELAAMLPLYADDGFWLLVENRLFVPLRARYAEDRLAEAYTEGVRQLVVLGAGLDSYAFRRPANQAELRIYEVDHPGMQRWKTDRIAALGWTVPESLHFVPCDFERTSVSVALRNSSFSSGQPSAVSRSATALDAASTRADAPKRSRSAAAYAGGASRASVPWMVTMSRQSSRRATGATRAPAAPPYAWIAVAPRSKKRSMSCHSIDIGNR